MRREIERAVAGYEAREGFKAFGRAVADLLVGWLWAGAVGWARHIRAQLRIKSVRSSYVAGPMRIGDEHPAHRGWWYTGLRNRADELLWYRPPSRTSRWIRRLGWAGYLAIMAAAFLAVALFERRHG